MKRKKRNRQSGGEGLGKLLDESKSAAPANQAAGMTVNELAIATGSDRRSIAKWLKQDGIAPMRKQKLGKHESDIYDRDQALACIARHQGGEPGTNGADRDPLTKLTWFQANLREQTLQRRRDNAMADALANETVMEMPKVETIMMLTRSKFLAVPDKMNSEFQLSDAAKKRLIQLVDEALQELSVGILTVDDA